MLKFTPEELIRLLQGNSTQGYNLPQDAELINIQYDVFAKQVITVIRSDIFDDIPENVPTPYHDVAMLQSNQSVVSSKQSLKVKQDVVPKNSMVDLQTSVASIVTPQKSLIQTLTTSMGQPVSSIDLSTGVKTLGTKPETNIGTCRFEDEFTKAQRKLLRFTSDDDYVIIKPIQYLKTEWEDINDIVRSIGGKWVKGGTIDYWIVPKNLKQEE